MRNRISSHHPIQLRFLVLLERRYLSHGDALRLEGKAQLAVEVAVPTDRAFFFAVGIDSDFLLDAVLAGAVDLWLGLFGHDLNQRGAGRHQSSEAEPNAAREHSMKSPNQIGHF